jgi:hypothetical protein
MASTIADVPYDTALADFKAAITPATGATFEVYQADEVTPAANLASGYKVIVIAQDLSTTKTYTISLTVPDIEITGFDMIAAINAGTVGSALDISAVQAALPSNVTANSGATTVPVDSWTDNDGYNPAQAGSYTFTATLGAIPDGYANAGGFTATVEVVVAEESNIITGITTTKDTVTITFSENIVSINMPNSITIESGTIILTFIRIQEQNPYSGWVIMDCLVRHLIQLL